MNFSQRMGYTPKVKQIQLENIDDDLKNRIWNIFSTYYATGSGLWINYGQSSNYYSLSWFGPVLIDKYFKISNDDFPKYHIDEMSFIKDLFYEEHRAWYEAYDFLEFVFNYTKICLKKRGIEVITNIINNVLREEFSGYRLIGEEICPITSESEITSIEETLINTDSGLLQPVHIHFKTALQFLSDKKNPDYRNSIKESISAIESVCKIINRNKSGELKDALNKLKTKINIHGAMESGFKSLYGYTSDSSGIRHGLTDLPDVDFDDAKYMLVSCSSFVNYLISKASKSGLIST